VLSLDEKIEKVRKEKCAPPVTRSPLLDAIETKWGKRFSFLPILTLSLAETNAIISSFLHFPFLCIFFHALEYTKE
jgi:hypothetical protein